MKTMISFALGVVTAIVGFRYFKVDTNKIKDDYGKIKAKADGLEEELNRDEDKDGC